MLSISILALRPNIRYVVSLLLALSLCASSVLVRAGDANEQAIVAHIDTELQKALQLLKTSVNINSGTQNTAGVKRVGLLFKAEFDAMGFQTQWLDGAEFGRSGHLVASINEGNSDTPNVLLIGHLDTVFAANDDFQAFRPIDDTRIAGPGITDMKGGDVIIIYALRALKALGLLDRLSVKVVLTGDEESSGKPLALSKRAIVDAAIWADVALGFEDGDSNIQTAVTSRRGSIGWTLKVTGNAAHSSQIFTDDVGDGAIFETARILNAFRTELKDEALLTFNPGLLAGGTRVDDNAGDSTALAFGKRNVVAQTTLVKGGLRAASPEQVRRAKATMQRVAQENLRHTSAQLSFDQGYPPMAQTAGNLELLRMYHQISLDLGYNPVTAVNPRNAGAADISFAAEYVDMALDGLGLMGSGGHTKDEVADMTSFGKNMHKAALLLYRLSLK